MGFFSFLNPVNLWNDVVKPAAKFTTDVSTFQPQKAFQDLQDTSTFTQAGKDLTGDLQSLAKLNPLAGLQKIDPLGNMIVNQVGNDVGKLVGGVQGIGRARPPPATTPAPAQTAPVSSSPPSATTPAEPPAPDTPAPTQTTPLSSSTPIGYAADGSVPAWTALLPPGWTPDQGITLDPSRAFDVGYMKQVMAQTAVMSSVAQGQPLPSDAFMQNAYNYWIPKFQNIGGNGLDNYWLSRLLPPGTSASGTPATSAVPGAPAPLPSSGPQANDPSTWTDNNAPYGVTLAGFSPQNHRDITPADLASQDPATVSKNAKYLVYNYFLANQTQPTNDWAPTAATALNTQYGTNIFHAIDGETLGYGDEYVHSAPNGYGMPQGTYNPNATGELFWGATSS
jgi:hypothetical protein